MEAVQNVMYQVARTLNDIAFSLKSDSLAPLITFLEKEYYLPLIVGGLALLFLSNIFETVITMGVAFTVFMLYQNLGFDANTAIVMLYVQCVVIPVLYLLWQPTWAGEAPASSRAQAQPALRRTAVAKNAESRGRSRSRGRAPRNTA